MLVTVSKINASPTKFLNVSHTASIIQICLVTATRSKLESKPNIPFLKAPAPAHAAVFRFVNQVCAARKERKPLDKDTVSFDADDFSPNEAVAERVILIY